jgi:hypothetical protein
MSETKKKEMLSRFLTVIEILREAKQELAQRSLGETEQQKGRQRDG